MNEMIERVAEAIRGEISESDDIATWVHKENAIKAAKAAIEAMREPTPQMVGVGWAKQGSGDNNPAEVEASYRAMIDAALAPSHPPWSPRASAIASTASPRRPGVP